MDVLLSFATAMSRQDVHVAGLHAPRNVRPAELHHHPVASLVMLSGASRRYSGASGSHSVFAVEVQSPTLWVPMAHGVQASAETPSGHHEFAGHEVQTRSAELMQDADTYDPIGQIPEHVAMDTPFGQYELSGQGAHALLDAP